MASIRAERVRELLKRELGEIIRRELPLADVGVVTVNEVTVPRDFQSATVYVGVVGSPEQRRTAMAELDKARKKIQGMVGRAIVLKYTPQLRFILDEAIERGNRVLEIIEQLEQSPVPHEKPPEGH
jgi:ribosome-binding factor A